MASLKIAYERRFGFVLISHAAILTAPARFGELASVTGNPGGIPRTGPTPGACLIVFGHGPGYTSKDVISSG